MNVKRAAGIVLLILLFFVGVTGGYFYFSRVLPKEKAAPEGPDGNQAKTDDFLILRMYYPAGNQLRMEERNHQRKTGQMEIAKAAIEEYFKGPLDPTTSNIPRDVKLLGLYRGADRILYVDLSDQLRRNFQGDAITEFYFLKGLYESIVSNVEDIQDVKILIEGKEAETVGGHLYLLYPLKDMVSYEYR